MTIVWDLIVLSFGRVLFAALRIQVPEKSGAAVVCASSESLSYGVRRHHEYLRALSVYSVAFGATAFSIWLVDARQHPHYRAAFRAAATCVTRAP
jgi:hypothetical protein